MNTNRSTIKRPCSQPQGFSDPQKSYIRETSYFTFLIFLGSSTPHQNTLNNPILFWTPEKFNIREIPFFQKILTFKICTPLEKSRFLNIFDSIGIHYILFLYTNYYSTFSQEWVGKYILTYQGKEGGILHLTYQGKEVGILHLTYQRKQYIAIYSKTLSQSLLFTNRIHTLHLTLYGKQRPTIYTQRKTATLCPPFLRTKDLFF